MRKSIKTFLLLCVFLSSSPAFSQSKYAEKNTHGSRQAAPSSQAAESDDLIEEDPFGTVQCYSKDLSDLSDFELMRCPGRHIEALDIQLNEAYKDALAVLPESERLTLHKAQRLWRQFVELDCDAYFGQGTGSYAGLWCATAKISEFEYRIARLKGLANRKQ